MHSIRASLTLSSIFLLHRRPSGRLSFFFFNDTATTEIYTLSLHDALPISFVMAEYGHAGARGAAPRARREGEPCRRTKRSEEHTSELQSLRHLVCRLLLEKKKKTRTSSSTAHHPTAGT